MKTVPNFKTHLRFAARAVPVIGVMLVGIKMVLFPPTLIDMLLPVPTGFVSEATCSSAYTTGSGNGSLGERYTRRGISIVTPRDMQEKEIDAELRAVARRAYQQGAWSVQVVAYTPDDSTPSQKREIRMLTFAPYGKWDRMDRIYDLKEYRTVINRCSPD